MEHEHPSKPLPSPITAKGIHLDWRNIFHAIGHPAFILDPEYHILKANKATLRATGLDEEALVGRRCHEIIHGMDHPPDGCPMSRVHMSREFETTEMEVQALGGVFLVSCTPVTDPANHELTHVIHIATDISSQKAAEQRLCHEVEEKGILLKEIHHRVKNNLQVISSLINLQSHQVDDPAMKAIFSEMQNRIRSMAFIHQDLYGSEDFSSIDMARYLEKLTHSLFTTYCLDPLRIETRVLVDAIHLGLDYAMPVGLVVNELVSNVIKYAFPPSHPGPCQMRVEMRQTDPGVFTLIVKDNGVGLPPDLDLSNTSSFGMHLMCLLVRDQLKGWIEVGREQGTEFRLGFTVDSFTPEP